MSWQVFVCANIPSPDLSAPSLNSAAEIQLQKSLLHLGRKDVGEGSRFLVSQMMTGFSRAQVSPWCKEDGSGSSSHCSDGVRWERFLLEGSSYKHIQCVLLEQNTGYAA